MNNFIIVNIFSVHKSAQTMCKPSRSVPAHDCFDSIAKPSQACAYVSFDAITTSLCSRRVPIDEAIRKSCKAPSGTEPWAPKTVQAKFDECVVFLCIYKTGRLHNPEGATSSCEHLITSLHLTYHTVTLLPSSWRAQVRCT